jgi:DNA transformation protein
MGEQSAFVTNILMLLAPMGEVRVKRMFGGYGLFHDDAMFALIPRKEELFLKADDGNREVYLERGRQNHGKMPYYSVPPEALKSWSAMEPWASGAVAAAMRAKRPPKKKMKRKTK